jgi:hypothetical protein
MNKRELEKMLNAVLRLSPAPLVFDSRIGRWKPLDVLWRVTGYHGSSDRRQIQIETTSRALGLVLRLFRDSIVEFQNEDHHHPSFKQGRLLLKTQWVIPPEGQPSWSTPIRPYPAHRRYVPINCP